MLNLCLPAGTAIELVQTLRRFPEFTRTPIFVFAGREHRTSANQVFVAGGNAFLPTPFNRQILFSLIAKFLPSEKILSSITPVLAVDPRQKQPVPFS